MSRPLVVVLGSLPPAGVALLRTRFDVEAAAGGGALSQLDRLRQTAALVADPTVRVDGTLLDHLGSSLAVVANFGVGYDNIDLSAARARGVRVTNTPAVLSAATAELALGLMLAAGRRIVEADALVRRGAWPDQLLGRLLVGATVGLVGFGRIARQVAQLLRGFEARILINDRSGRAAYPGATRLELRELLAEADFVSLHVPLTADTRHLIGHEEIDLMKQEAVLVNTSRGAVVDTVALTEALADGRIAAAGLDVYEDEPDVPIELRELPNTVLLPHIGSATADTRDAMARLCAENVIAVIDGREPPTPVL